MASNHEKWLARVDALVIELHDSECPRVFREAIAHEDFELSTCDDLTVLVRRQLAPMAHQDSASLRRRSGVSF